MRQSVLRQGGCPDEADLGPDEGGSDVQAGVLGVRDPLLVDLHQLPDALQKLRLIEELQEEEHDNGRESLTSDEHAELLKIF